MRVNLYTAEDGELLATINTPTSAPPRVGEFFRIQQAPRRVKSVTWVVRDGVLIAVDVMLRKVTPADEAER